MAKGLKSPNRTHSIAIGLTAAVLVTIEEVLVPREAAAVVVDALGRTPIGLISKIPYIC